MRRRYNNLTIEAYSTGTTRITDPKNELVRAQGINFNSFFPGGLFGSASFYVPRNVVDWWELNAAQRFVIRNDLNQCWEGHAANFQSAVEETGQGCLVRLTGPWGDRLMNWTVGKRWADTRISEDAWATMTDTAVYAAADKCDIDRNNRLRFTPKSTSGTWSTGHMAALQYVMPIGQTVKRITFDYTLVTPASFTNWSLRTLDRTTPGTIDNIQRTSAGTSTGSKDLTLGTPVRTVEFNFYPDSNYTNPPSDGTLYAEIRNVVVYSETGSINMEEIAKDLVGIITDLNSDTRYIYPAGTALSLVPYISDDESAADILADVSGRGDGLYNRWAATLQGSERAFVPDGKPLLFLGPYPAITDYEYAVRLDDPNLVLPVEISEDRDAIRNWIIMKYSDPNGVLQRRTPDDNAALKDVTSIADYKRRDEILTLPGTSTSTIADAVGQRYLATFKDPQYRLTSPVTVQGFIRGKGGHKYPASEIRAGHRLRIENYGQDGSLTFMVTGTFYDDDTQTCQLTVGVPEAPLALRYTPPAAAAPTVPAPAGGGGGGGGGGRTITAAMLRKMKTTRAKWAKMTPGQRRAKLRAAGYL